MTIFMDFHTKDIDCDIADRNIQIIGVVALVNAFGFHWNVEPFQSVHLERSQRWRIFLRASFVLERLLITNPTCQN